MISVIFGAMLGSLGGGAALLGLNKMNKAKNMRNMTSGVDVDMWYGSKRGLQI